MIEESNQVVASAAGQEAQQIVEQSSLEEKPYEDEALEESRRKLVELEMWGQMKRWNDINFVHRMRNMRSQLVFDMDKAHIEKVMERQWHLKNNKLHDAARIQRELLGPWEEQTMQEKERQMGVKWTTRVDVDSIKDIEPNGVSFKIQVAPIRLGILGDFQDRYQAQILATEIGIFQVKIKHIHEVSKAEEGYGEDSEQFTRLSLADIQDGPFKTNELLKSTEKMEFKTTVDNDNNCLLISYASLSPVLAGTIKNQPVKEFHKLYVELRPFKITHTINGKSSQIVYNANGLLSIEPKAQWSFENRTKPIERDLLDSRSFAMDLTSQQELWNEKTFCDMDEEIRSGPQAISFDISIGNGESDEYSVFGLGERCEGKLSLENTIQWEPYRLWTSDHYASDRPKSSMYGIAPIVQVKTKSGNKQVGNMVDAFFWANASDTFIDVFSDNPDLDMTSSDFNQQGMHWMSESGQLEFYIMSSASPENFSRKLASLTGKPQLPPLWALGYHQCKWNYMTEDELLDVSAGMTKHSIPCDSVWLDIEYADGKRYFTWDKNSFKRPRAMLEKIVQDQRRLVTIIDPHVKFDEEYFVYAEGKQRGVLVQDKNRDPSKPYHGKCWPMTSAWVDYMNPKSLDFVKLLYAKQEVLDKISYEKDDYIWLDASVGIWIDMNEPACFELTDKTMSKTNIHTLGIYNQRGEVSLKSVEHRDVHSLYGFFSSQKTYNALLERSPERPFILSRSFYPGTQQHAAIWSGDAGSDWANFDKVSTILLQKSIAGISFVGGDVPGFYGNPVHKDCPELEEKVEYQYLPKGEVEMKTDYKIVKKPNWDKNLVKSWYRLGAFMPFFRAHSHLDGFKREPWCFPDDVLENIRDTMQLRYRMLAYLYTQVYLSTNVEHGNCTPILRPLWYQDPCGRHEKKNEASYYFGDSVIVTPHPYKNKIGQIKTSFEIDDQGRIVHSKSLENPPIVRAQLAQGKIIPMLAFTQQQLLNEVHSTKYITDNIKDLKFDILIFPHPYDVKSSTQNQCLAQGYLYLDDMLTRKHATANECLFINIKLMGDGHAEWFQVEIIHNEFAENGLHYDESVHLPKQTWVDQIIIHRHDQLSPDDSKVVTVFDKIVSGELREGREILYEDERCMAFKDVKQVSKVHFLVIPKFRQGLSSISKATEQHEGLLGYLMVVASKLAKQFGLDKFGYRLVVNDGVFGMQDVPHFHIHVIGGQQLSWPPGVPEGSDVSEIQE